MTHKRLEATAYHEAGHAVIGVHLGRPLRYVTITPHEDSAGHVATPTWGKKSNPDFEMMNGRIEKMLEHEILALMAGRIAEKRLTGRWNHAGAKSDRLQEINFASRLVGEGKVLELYLAYMRQRAEDMVAWEFNWSAIQALAEALVLKPRLGSRAVRQIILRARGLEDLAKSLAASQKARHRQPAIFSTPGAKQTQTRSQASRKEEL